MEQVSKKRRVRIYIPVGVVIIIILTGAIFWYRDYSKYFTTDDAHVDANNITVSSKMLGRIVAIYADEGDFVQKGELLAVLDSSDLIAQKNQAEAAREQTRINLNQAAAKYNSDLKNLQVMEINLERASEDIARAKKQAAGEVITEEQMDHITKAYEAASAQLEASRALLQVSKSQISLAEAAIKTADAQIKVIETQLKNTKLFSPANGVVAKRWLLPGDIMQPSQSVFTITDTSELWVLAYLEETKISGIQDGQKVKFTIDAFPHEKFSGKVFNIGTSTASVFSLIPPNNASGNFTKVTQRIPLRISIDSANNGTEISSLNIKSGMSAVVKISRKQS
jgi:membrane fusion protein (multidrug efflux system)